MENFVFRLKFFLEKLLKNKKINSNKIEFEFIITLFEPINNTNCIAIVNNLVRSCEYQCTKKRKHGMFCGLHNNRKNNFKTIEKKILKQKKILFLTEKMEEKINPIRNDPHKNDLENDSENDHDENDIEDIYNYKLVQLYFNGCYYFLNPETNLLYILNKNDDTYSCLGNIKEFKHNYIVV